MFFVTVFVDDNGEEMGQRLCGVGVPVLGIEARQSTSWEVRCKGVGAIDQTVEKRVKLCD